MTRTARRRVSRSIARGTLTFVLVESCSATTESDDEANRGNDERNRHSDYNSDQRPERQHGGAVSCERKKKFGVFVILAISAVFALLGFRKHLVNH